MRCTERSEIPLAAAIARPVQCVAAPSGSARVSLTTRSCSWANAVESFFATLTRRRLQRGVFRSPRLQAAINRYLGEHNRKPKPFVWTADPDRIALDERGVTFRYKDYRRNGPARYCTITLSADEFIRRFLLHVLPKGFSSQSARIPILY